jgi:hypothetical protein
MVYVCRLDGLFALSLLSVFGIAVSMFESLATPTKQYLKY